MVSNLKGDRRFHLANGAATAILPPFERSCRFDGPSKGTTQTMEANEILQEVRRIADGFAAERRDRQRRRELDRADFAKLASAGFLLTGVPAKAGGLFESVPRSTRTIAEMLRAIAHGDASVALVSSMHPAVLIFWLATDKVDERHQAAWDAQRALLADLGKADWFGTITSEPGSGGDVARSKAVARPSPQHGWTLTGQKHFGSGSGNTSFMMTVARAEGEEQPDIFFADFRGVPWDGSRGVRLTAPWDGHGMTSTSKPWLRVPRFPGNPHSLAEQLARPQRSGGRLLRHAVHGRHPRNRRDRDGHRENATRREGGIARTL